MSQFVLPKANEFLSRLDATCVRLDLLVLWPRTVSRVLNVLSQIKRAQASRDTAIRGLYGAGGGYSSHVVFGTIFYCGSRGSSLLLIELISFARPHARSSPAACDCRKWRSMSQWPLHLFPPGKPVCLMRWTNL